MHVVLDTNVVVAGWLWRGTCYELLGHAVLGSIRCVTSEILIRELERVLDYPHLASRVRIVGTSVKEVVADYRALVEIVEPALISPTVVRDPPDDQVLACALGAGVDLIVSGNDDLLNLKRFHGIEIVNPGEMIGRLQQRVG